MILTFFVSAPAVTTDKAAKINDNEHTLQATRRLNNLGVSPSKRAAVIAYLHPSRTRIALANEQGIEAWHARQRSEHRCRFLVILLQATTTRRTFDGALRTGT
jgi:hypothetical protein